MNRELIDQVQREFSGLCPEDHPPHLDHPSGWDKLFLGFCRKLSIHVESAKAKVIVLGTKEKYARLEIAVRGEHTYPNPFPKACGQCKAKFTGKVKFCPECGAKIGYNPGRGAYVRGLIEDTQGKSQEICQECGEPGGWRDVEGWEYTLCDRHHAGMLWPDGVDLPFEDTSTQERAIQLLRDAPPPDELHAVRVEWQAEVTDFLTSLDKPKGVYNE